MKQRDKTGEVRSVAISEAQKRAKKKYDAKAYDMVSFRLPKGKKAEIQTHANNRGESFNGFLNRVILEALESESTENCN